MLDLDLHSAAHARASRSVAVLRSGDHILLPAVSTSCSCEGHNVSVSAKTLEQMHAAVGLCMQQWGCKKEKHVCVSYLAFAQGVLT